MMLKSKEAVQEVTFSIKGVDLLEFWFNQPKAQGADVKVYHYDILIEHQVNNEHNILLVVTCVELFNEARDFNFGAIKVGCAFELDDLKKYFDNKTKKYIIPKGIIEVLNSVSLSTTRGVMFSQLRGTYLHNAVLPIIDPKTFKIGEK
jgi:hypothetical protein